MPGPTGRSTNGQQQDRVGAGLARARAKGKRLGRPPALTRGQVERLRTDRETGMSLRALARKYGTTAPTVWRVLSVRD